MTKARDLANLISTGNPLSDGAVSVAEVTGAAPLASPTFTGGVSLGDNVKLKLGDGEDLEVYHDSTHSIIKDAGTGDLWIAGDNALNVTTADFTEYKARFVKDESVYLFHNNAEKFKTTATGADVTGGLTISGGTATQLQTSSSSVDGNIFADVHNTNTGSSSAIVQRMITSNVAGNGTTSADFQKTKAGALNINNNETNSAAIIGLSIGGGEKFRFGSAGQLGIGGATYGTAGQVLTSGGSGAAPTWVDAGGGAYEVLSDAAYTSNTNSVTFTVAPDYLYTLEFTGWINMAGHDELQIETSHDGFSSTKDMQWWTSRHNIWSQTEAHLRGQGSYYENAFARISYGQIASTSLNDASFGILHFSQRTGCFANHYGTIFEPTPTSPEGNYPQSTRSASRTLSTDTINRIRLKANSGPFRASRIRLLRRS